MAWFSGKVSIGNFPDLAGAVSKFSEGVKNIEKTFDSALGLEGNSDATAAAASSESEASGIWPSAADRKALFDPIMGFMGQKGGETPESLKESSSSSKPSSPINDNQPHNEERVTEKVESLRHDDAANEESRSSDAPIRDVVEVTGDEPKEVKPAEDDGIEGNVDSPLVIPAERKPEDFEPSDSSNNLQEEDLPEKVYPTLSQSAQLESVNNIISDAQSSEAEQTTGGTEFYKPISETESVNSFPDSSLDRQNPEKEISQDVVRAESPEGQEGIGRSSASDIHVENSASEVISHGELPVSQHNDAEATRAALNIPLVDTSAEPESEHVPEEDNNIREQVLRSGTDAESVVEHEKLKKEMKMIEAALQGAAKQAQAKADEISKLMTENEELKGIIEDLKRKTTEADIESLREEYHYKVSALERKVYALTKERDTLRREQNKKSDATALLKEKDEIITQVMAEGEQLSKKQAVQETQIRKLRSQIRELEEEKKGLQTKLQVVEENKVESIKRDKAATEKLLQETVEKHHAELAAQKEYYSSALNAAKEAEALAEARASTETRTELESRLREVEDRESILIQTLEELRQTLSRKEQQAVFREDTLRRDIDDLQKRYQASERRCEELITQVPESTRPLLRQIEAIQETASRRAEAWTAVERSLTSRLQEAEAKAAAAEEKERSINERLTQTLSRINVLEAQISCLRAEQTQLTRSLEKERQRAAENRHEYLALKEVAETHESNANQLENEISELRKKHRDELREMRTNQEQLQQDLEREKAARFDQELAVHRQPSSAVSESTPLAKTKSTASDNGNLSRKLSSASSLNGMEESYFLQSTLDPSKNSSSDLRASAGDAAASPYYIKSMTSSTFEAALRQKDGELASYASRLSSLESIRDSLAEELVKMTAE
ncbi:hypothetical protein M569_04783, partial [Genlisea aurea]